MRKRPLLWGKSSGVLSAACEEIQAAVWMWSLHKKRVLLPNSLQPAQG